MTILWLVIAAILVADALRIRRNLNAVAVLAPSEAPAGDAVQVLAGPGAAVDDATRRAAAAHARAEGLEALDLWPADLPASKALVLGGLFDPKTYRRSRFAHGQTASHAVLVTRELEGRARLAPLADPVAWVDLARRVKRHACTTTDVAVAPGLAARPDDPRWHVPVVRAAVGRTAPFVIGGQLLVVLLPGLAFLDSILAGAAVAAAWHIQPLVATAGTAFRPRDLALTVLLRTPLEIATWIRAAASAHAPRDPDPAEAARPAYEALLAGGLDPFFEPRRERCPLCDGADLRVHVRTSDLLQRKPGAFTLERCTSCGHVFQNPRLSLEGLAFYYRDFYDGLGEADLESLFGAGDGVYLDRARLLAGVSPRPARWLDVGGGHGHFCCAAREVFPEARFDALDFGESIEEAARRRWVDRAWRGLFPDLARDLDGAYDVVVMSHYLEHTRDPRAELAAARRVLVDGGHLLIEVPSPDSPMGRLLGRWWLPWFQPQHQHLLSATNLGHLFDEAGFEPVAWQWGEPHLPLDLTFAVLLVLRVMAPVPDAPWRPRTGLLRRAWHRVVWGLSPLVVLPALALDRAIAPWLRRPGKSSAYRVLARRRGPEAATARA